MQSNRIQNVREILKVNLIKENSKSAQNANVTIQSDRIFKVLEIIT